MRTPSGRRHFTAALHTGSVDEGDTLTHASGPRFTGLRPWCLLDLVNDGEIDSQWVRGPRIGLKSILPLLCAIPTPPTLPRVAASDRVCRRCGAPVEIHSPSGPHYAGVKCPACRYFRWLRKPRNEGGKA